MRCSLLVCLTATILTHGAHGISEYEALKVVKDFADHFLSPKNVQVASGINRYVESWSSVAEGS
jgi:hypothetical protein